MHRICIKDIQKDIPVGEGVCSVFLVGSAQKSEGKNGPFWAVKLRDSTGTLDAKIWTPLSQNIAELKMGDFVEVKGRTSTFREQLQFTIEALRPVDTPEELVMSDFIQTSAVEPSEILAQIEKKISEEITYAPWKDFCKSVLKDQRIRAKLLLAPAAKSVHHAYAGGLLEHMFSVASLCLKLSDHYPELDRQTLFVAGLFHDIGKLDELSGGLANDYTDEGKMLGHIIQGILILKPFLEKAKVDPALALHFEHLILSHHGEPEFGAPRVPLSPEAFCLHYADNMDAKLAQCREAFSQITDKKESEKEEPEGGEIAWSAWINLLGRSLCKMPQTPKAKEKESSKAKKDPKGKQGSLMGFFG